MYEALMNQRNVYRLFGYTVASNHPLTIPALEGHHSPDLTFTCQNISPIPGTSEAVPPAYSSLTLTEAGESAFILYRFDAYEIMHFAHVADFYLWADRIVCHLLNSDHKSLVEGHLLAAVFAYWLERRGIPALHASSVVIDDHAVAFISHSGNGKSTLAIALMQVAHALLTDDILPLVYKDQSFFGQPGYAQIRLWPHEIEYFIGDCEQFERVHPSQPKRRIPVHAGTVGTFCDTAQPLACFYLPERRDPAEWGTGIEIIPISPRDAVLELLRYSFVANIVAALGWQARRLDFFVQLVQQVPVRRLIYPDGFEHLPRVRDRVLEDINGSNS